MNNWQSKFFFSKNIPEDFSAISHFTIHIAGICDCFDDCGICCYGCWCTSCLYGENAVQIDGSDYDDACWAFITSGRNPLAFVELMDNRRTLREKYSLPEEPCNDCTVIFCCLPCAVCQAARELKFWNNMPGEYFFVYKNCSNVVHDFPHTLNCVSFVTKNAEP